MSDERKTEDADTFAARICAEHGLPRSEIEYRGWLRAAWYVGYDAGLTRASRLLDRDLKIEEAP